MGQNKLGVMLMALRDELRGGLPASEGGGFAPPAAFDAAMMDKTHVAPAVDPAQQQQQGPVVVINAAAPGLAQQQAPQPIVGNGEVAPPTLQINTEPLIQTGGGMNPAPYPILNAFNPAPAPSNAVTLGAQANTPPCGQLPSNGATAAPSVEPVAQVPTPEPEYKVLTVSSDPNAAGKK
jgi:hypothetical protein